MLMMKVFLKLLLVSFITSEPLPFSLFWGWWWMCFWNLLVSFWNSLLFDVDDDLRSETCWLASCWSLVGLLSLVTGCVFHSLVWQVLGKLVCCCELIVWTVCRLLWFGQFLCFDSSLCMFVFEHFSKTGLQFVVCRLFWASWLQFVVCFWWCLGKLQFVSLLSL